MAKEKNRRSTAYHEAGHAVAQARFKLKIKRVSIVEDVDSLGVMRGRLATILSRAIHDNSGKMRLNVESDVIVCLAGMAAQSAFMPRSVRKHHARGDHEIAVRLLNIITASNEELTAYVKLLEIRAKQLMKRRCIRVQVKALAKALLIRKTLKGEEVKAVISGAFSEAVEARSNVAAHSRRRSILAGTSVRNPAASTA